MRSLEEFAATQARRPRPREPPSRAGGDRPARRHLGRAQRPAPALVLLQRLPRADPPPRGQGRGHRGDAAPRRRQRRLPPGDRQPSAVRRARTAPRPAQGHRGGLRVRLRLPRQWRHHSGADRPRRPRADRRAGACLPVGRRAALARHRAAIPAFRRGACRGAARRAPRPSPARPDRDRRRVLHGRRPRAAARAVGDSRGATTRG